MNILIFTEGTVIVHASAKGKTREEIVRQSKEFGGIDYLPNNLNQLKIY